MGEVRTGVAVSDELGMIASAHDTIQVSSHEADAAAVKNIVDDREAVRVVVGLPLNQNGEIGPQAEKVLAFVEVLRGVVGVDVETIDERFSTVSANRALAQAGVKGKKRRKVVDKVAAQQILQLYLDRESFRRARES